MTVGKCVACVCIWRDLGEGRKDKGRYWKFISKHGLTGLALFILPILQVRKSRLRDNE